MEVTFADVRPDQAAMADEVGPLIRALRPGLSERDFAGFAVAAAGQGLTFTVARDGRGACVGVATHRLLETSRGRLLQVDDLVTDPGRRSAGVGARLLAEVTERARRAGCTRIELDSGVSNHGAHRFYHAARMSIVALHFSRRLD